MSSENALSPTSPPAHSKSRIMRMLTTRRPKDPDSTPPSSSRRPPVVNSAFSKEGREAALRARGLLPPLSLSQQERELDNTIPVVKPASPLLEDGEVKMSAADIIKQQWEAKNKEVQEKEQQRLDSFTFGPPKAESYDEAEEPNASDEFISDSSKPQEPIPKAAKARRRQGMHQASLSQPMQLEAEALKDLEHRRSLSVQTKGLPAIPEGQPKEAASVTPILDLPTEFQYYLDQPPPPSLLKTPPRPSLSDIQDSTTSMHTESTATGQRSPRRPPHNDGKPLPTSQSTHDTIVAPVSAISPSDTLVSPSHGRNDSIPRAESNSSSTHTPSLDSASSTMKSSESLTNAKQGKTAVKFAEDAIPVIAGSHSECGPHEAHSVEHCASDDKGTAIRSASGHDDIGGGDLANGDGDSPPPVPSKGRRRGLTDPPTPKPAAEAADQVLGLGDGPAPTRRKTINPFKRNQQREDGAGGKISLRSVVGTVLRSRDRSGPGARLASPTRPQEQDSYESPPQSPKRQPAVVRQAVNPVYYSGGDIQAQANTIKDDEERRMAELAFMF